MRTTARRRARRTSRSSLPAAWTLVPALLLAPGCASTGPNEGPASYYRPAGWLDPASSLDAPDFAAYRADATRRVREHRRVVDTDDPAREIELVSPAEFAPSGRGCDAAAPRAAVILVHGLSDTAFAMRDLAEALAARCFLTRTLLLPGHGTVPGDLLAVDHEEWLASVRRAVERARAESDEVAVVGFSLGAVLGLSLALEPDRPVDALVTISPAFHLSSWRLARWAPWVHRLRPWVDRELPDDRFRYEAMPTRGVAETVRAVRELRRRVAEVPAGVDTPWMLIQSEDDAVVVPEANLAFFLERAVAPSSRALLFRSASAEASGTDDDPRVSVLPGSDAATRVLGLTHVAVHVSPANAHYGVDGTYRNCGATGGRAAASVARCEAAEPGELDFGLWGGEEDVAIASARSTFNPRFDRLVDAIDEFLDPDGGRSPRTAD